MLTAMQKEFCYHYCKCLNATKAAELAGYKIPHNAGSRNLKNAEVQEFIAELNKPEEDKKILSIRENQEMLSEIARGEVMEERIILGKTSLFPVSYNTRLKALELLGKSQGMFLERHEVSSDININIGFDENE